MEKSDKFGDTPGYKLDLDKLRTDLVTAEMTLGLAQVLTIGATKYADRNWEKGMSWMRVYASLSRHLLLWLSGEDVDDETGLLHMDQVMTNAGFLSTYTRRRNTLAMHDDRPHVGYVIDGIGVTGSLIERALCNLARAAMKEPVEMAGDTALSDLKATDQFREEFKE